jgi:hypothetical protein
MLTSTRNQLLARAMGDEVPRLEDRNQRLAEAMGTGDLHVRRHSFQAQSMEIYCVGPT